MLPIFDIRCSYQLVNSNIQVGAAARNIEFGNNLANFDLYHVNSNIQVGVVARNIEFGDNLAKFDSSCTLNSMLGVIPSAYDSSYNNT